ncbi:MAG: NUDIX hydrolase [Proteobacteria bacterium]|nr:MAG: NUDIX hydrolase [Pseudomonadota bacterium]QKK12550.1 MAG: NUDIX hydrolase [Pseudomonadota bacterium]
MRWTPHLTVAAIAERNKTFLMVEERINGNLVLNQPAGHLNDAESLLEAVVRETLEETGWHFHPESLVGIYRWRNPENGETYLRAALSGECTDHEPRRPLDDGIEGVLWLSHSQIVARTVSLRSPLVLRCLDDYLSGTRYPLALLQNLP